MEELRIFASKSDEYVDPESGTKIHLTCLVGGDMKYLLLIYGLSAPTANFPCLFCTIKKTEFHAGENNCYMWFLVRPSIRWLVGWSITIFLLAY